MMIQGWKDELEQVVQDPAADGEVWMVDHPPHHHHHHHHFFCSTFPDDGLKTEILMQPSMNG